MLITSFYYGGVVLGVSKNYGVENCNNLRMVQYNNAIFFILRHGTYSLYLGVCEVSIKYVKGN